MKNSKFIALIAVLLTFCIPSFGQAVGLPRPLDDPALQNALGGGYYDGVLQYGAKGNGARGTGGATSSGTANFTDSAANFTAFDVGKVIAVSGAGAGSRALVTTIAAFTDSTHVTLAATASNTLSGANYAYGTDDSTSIQNAVNAAFNSPANSGTVFLRPGIYVLSTGINWKSRVSLLGSGVGATVLMPINTSTSTLGPGSAIYGLSAGSPATPYTDCEFRHFEIDGIYQAGSSFSVGVKGIYIQYMMRPLFFDLYIHDTMATGLGVDFLGDCKINGVNVNGCGRGGSTTTAGSSGIGIGTGGGNLGFLSNGVSASMRGSGIITNCHAFNNKRYGIFIESQNLSDDGWTVSNCKAEKNGFAGIGVAGSDRSDVVIGNDCNNNAGYGIYIGADTITPKDAPYQFLVSGNNCHSNVGAQICVDWRYVSAANSFVKSARGVIQGNICSPTSSTLPTNTHGIQVLVAATYGLSDLDICDNQIQGNRYHGITISGAGTVDRLSLRGNKIYNNSQSAAGTYNAFDLTGPTFTNLLVTDNECYDNQATQTQGYGFKVGGFHAD